MHIHQIVFDLIFVFSYCVSTSKINDILLKNSHKTFEKKIWKTVWKIVWNTTWKTVWKIKIFMNCMHVSLKNWIYDKRYMFWAHATIKYARKKRIFEIIVVEIRFEKKEIMSRFLFDNISYYSCDIICFIIEHRFANFDDSQIRIFFFILKY